MIRLGLVLGIGLVLGLAMVLGLAHFNILLFVKYPASPLARILPIATCEPLDAIPREGGGKFDGFRARFRALLVAV